MSIGRPGQLLRMRRRHKSRTRWSAVWLLGIAAIAAMPSAPCRGQASPAAQIAIAVADFDYTDTSGEVQNQVAAHDAQLRAFVGAFRSALGADTRYQLVKLECHEPPCTAGRLAAGGELIERARAAGAQLLLYGGIHKMSTLISNAKVQVIDVAADKLLFDRLVSFRGDGAEAWERAQRFLVRDLTSANLGAP